MKNYAVTSHYKQSLLCSFSPYRHFFPNVLPRIWKAIISIIHYSTVQRNSFSFIYASKFSRSKVEISIVCCRNVTPYDLLLEMHFPLALPLLFKFLEQVLIGIGQKKQNNLRSFIEFLLFNQRI